jgi:hypothetical protein
MEVEHSSCIARSAVSNTRPGSGRSCTSSAWIRREASFAVSSLDDEMLAARTLAKELTRSSRSVIATSRTADDSGVDVTRIAVVGPRHLCDVQTGA